MSLYRWTGRVEQTLDRYLPRHASGASPGLIDAMRYSALSRGKRLRPALAYETAAAFGAGPERVDRFAAAIEMIHAYSLIHDDLPCMDDDDLRRGRPTCHRVFGEACALLAGDGLLSGAAALMSAAALEDPRAVRAQFAVLSRIGIDGIVGGQALDISQEGASPDEAILIEIHRRKTAALFAASVLCGGALGGASDMEMEALEAYGYHVGCAFQIADDILNATGDTARIGKAVGSDARRGKMTAVSVWGLEGAMARMADHTGKACGALVGTACAAPLSAIARGLTARDA